MSISLEEFLTNYPKYEPGSDVFEYLTGPMWRVEWGEHIETKLGLRRALSVTGLDQHPDFAPDRVEFAIRCCGGDPDEVFLYDFIAADGGWRTDKGNGGERSYQERLNPRRRAIYLILEGIARKEGLAR